MQLKNPKKNEEEEASNRSWNFFVNQSKMINLN